MRYLLVLALAFLLVGNVFADAIPVVTDAQNQPTVWTQSVYFAAACVSGFTVIWDFGSSDTDGDFEDMCMWAKQANVADSPWTAGVLPLDRDAAAGSVMDIIVRGPAIVYNADTDCTVNTFVSTGTSGQAADEGCASNDEMILGVCITADAVLTRPDQGSRASIIYVIPSPYTSD